MRLAFAADFHGSQRHFTQFLELARQQQADVAIVGGDLFPIARPYEEMLRVQKEFAATILPSMLESHRNLGGCPIYLLPGNNDWNEAFLELRRFESDGLVACARPAVVSLAEGFSLVTQPFVPPTPFRMKDFDRRDLAVEPCPDQPNPVFYSEGDQIKQADIGDYLSGRSSLEEEIEQLDVGALVAEKAIWVTHSPPFGTGLDRTVEGMEVGSKAIRAAIEKRQPRLSLHGHIHEAPKVTGTFACRLGQTIAVNPGQSISEVYAVVIDLGSNVVLRHTDLGVLTLDRPTGT